MKQVNPFYKSKRWIKKKNHILKKYEYTCQQTLRYGTTVDAETVHHIYPLELYPELSLVDWNLLPVTNEAHNTFHSRKDHSITAKGKYWQKKEGRSLKNGKEKNQIPLI
ncbi:HNH endonuclease [Enterococcus termitis]